MTPEPCRAYLNALHSDARRTLPGYAPMERETPALLSRWRALGVLVAACLALWGGAVLCWGIALAALELTR